MTEFFNNDDKPSWEDIIKTNQAIVPLFKIIHQKDLSKMLIYIKLIVDKNEEREVRNFAKLKLNNLLDTYLQE